MRFFSVRICMCVFTEPCYKMCGGMYANFLDMAFGQNSLRGTIIEHPYLMAVQCGLCNCPSRRWYCVGPLDPTQTNTEGCTVAT